MESIRQLLALRMKQLRESKSLTQEKLAERANMAKTHIGHIETGRRWPKPESLEAIAAALGVESKDLFQEPGNFPKPTPQQALDVLSDFIKNSTSR